ncbi:uncharacterized protein TNCV_4755881 [Trichonephila clavipes]|nr:uncharacterized protein TNCV_4755881 [Trichonephila clavipes]
MSRFGGLSEERPSVFKTRSKLGTHLSTQCSGDERQSRPCAAHDRRHLDAFTRGRIIGKLEGGRSVTSVAAEFGIAHSIVSRPWRQFQTRGTAIRGVSSDRPRGTTPADDRFIVLQARRNRRQTAGGAMGLQFLFMDDNAPCHRTVAAKQLLESEDIERMDWPARSLDLNPIEHVWDFLGRRLAARTLPPVTIRELRLALQDEWAATPQHLIDTLILSMGSHWTI